MSKHIHMKEIDPNSWSGLNPAAQPGDKGSTVMQMLYTDFIEQEKQKLLAVLSEMKKNKWGYAAWPMLNLYLEKINTMASQVQDGYMAYENDVNNCYNDMNIIEKIIKEIEQNKDKSKDDPSWTDLAQRLQTAMTHLSNDIGKFMADASKYGKGCPKVWNSDGAKETFQDIMSMYLGIEDSNLNYGSAKDPQFHTFQYLTTDQLAKALYNLSQIYNGKTEKGTSPSPTENFLDEWENGGTTENGIQYQGTDTLSTILGTLDQQLLQEINKYGQMVQTMYQGANSGESALEQGNYQLVNNQISK